ncbi:hypothetical protein V2J09_021441 [Rumex salicifolius]
MLFMFEYRGAKLLISEQFPETAGSITSFRVESDVVSLNGREPLQADAEIGDDGKLHVVVRRSTASSSVVSGYNNANQPNKSHLMTPRASNLTGVEIYSIQSSREPTPRASSFNQTDFYAMFASKASSPKFGGGGGGGDQVFSLQSSKGVTPRTSNFDHEEMMIKRRYGRSMSGELYNGGGSAGYPPPNPMFSVGGPGAGGGVRRGAVTPPPIPTPNQMSGSNSKDLHMFVWSSSASPVSEHMKNAVINRGGSTNSLNDVVDSSKAVLQQEINAARGMHDFGGNVSPNKGGKMGAEKEMEVEDMSKIPTSGASPYTKKIDMDEEMELGGPRKAQMPPASVMTRLILIMVWRKLIRNPNTYSSLLGLIWSLVSYRWNVEMPTIVKGSISILSDAGLGMAMFSLGLFMALQPKLIACGKRVATFTMAVRFLTGPAVIAATGICIGLRGVLLHIAIVQAALPQGIVPFVFAKEYNVHPDILSTGVIFGMLIALPITILYYVLLGV